MKTVISVIATFVLLMGGYLIFRDPKKKATDKKTTRDFLWNTWQSVRKYLSYLFKTHEEVGE